MKQFIVAFSFTCLFLAGCSLQPQPLDQPATALEPQATGWKFVGSNPLNVNTNSSADSPSQALDSSGNPVVSWSEYDGISYNIYVKRWNGTSWLQLWTKLDVYLNRDAKFPSLALDNSGNPVVAWQEDNGLGIPNIFVKRWNGTNWVQLGSFLNIDNHQDAYNPSLALDSSGNPTVSWSEFDGTSRNIYVKRWNGSSWVQLGTFLDANTNQNAHNPSLALNSSGNPMVSWVESDGTSWNIYVKRWTGTSWIKLGTFLDANTNQLAHHPSLALDSAGKPVVSWEEYGGTSWNIYVKRWNGTSWVQLGTSLDVNTNKNATDPSLALDSSGNPTVSWFEDDGTAPLPVLTTYNLYVKRWTGSSWLQLGSFLDANTNQSAFYPSLALDSSGNPVVSWSEFDGTSNKIYIKRYGTNAWRNLGNALDVTLNATAYSSSIARKSDDKPVVAWQEQFIGGATNFDTNVYAKEWTGSDWNLLGQVNHQGKSGSLPSLALQTDNKPVVAYLERYSADLTSESSSVYVRRWSGTTWQDLGGALTSPTSIRGLSLAVGSSNTPIVAFATCPASCSLYVKKWNGTNWVGMNGSATPAPVYSGFVTSLALALDSTGKPSVVWAGDFLSPSVKVKRWNGTSWVNYGSGVALNPTGTGAYLPSLKLRSDNQPVVAYGERNASGHFDAYVKRWIGTAWLTIANSLNNSPSGNASQASLVLSSNNNPSVSWIETQNFNDNLYVKAY
jgi:hypothetical protein